MAANLYTANLTVRNDEETGCESSVHSPLMFQHNRKSTFPSEIHSCSDATINIHSFKMKKAFLIIMIWIFFHLYFTDIENAALPQNNYN